MTNDEKKFSLAADALAAQLYESSQRYALEVLKAKEHWDDKDAIEIVANGLFRATSEFVLQYIPEENHEEVWQKSADNFQEVRELKRKKGSLGGAIETYSRH